MEYDAMDGIEDLGPRVTVREVKFSSAATVLGILIAL